MTAEVNITGIADINRLLAQIAPQEGINLMRATIHDMAGQLAKTAKAGTPQDSGSFRAGTKPKRRRGTPTTVKSDVVVSGAFYWRYLEYGQGPDGVEHAMFLRALQEMRTEIDRVYLESFKKKLAARLAKLRKRAAV